MTVVVPRLLSARAAASLTRMPWFDLRAELERRGYRIVRIGGRERVAEADLAALIEAARQPTAAEAAARVDLALDQVAEEMGLRRRPRSARR